MHDDYWQSDKLKTVLRPFIHNLFRQHGNKVLHGPFKGMEIPELEGWDEWTVFLKLFGDYERELHSTIEQAIARKPQVVVNAGCAEGYYAIGFARALPNAVIYAVDANSDFVEICNAYADKNNTKVHSIVCAVSTPDDLHVHHPVGKRLYFLDCEGAEFTALDPDRLIELKLADLIVELHDKDDKSKTQKLISKFEDTHDIEIIPHEIRTLFSIIIEWKFNNTFDGVSIWDKREDSGFLVAWAREDDGNVKFT